MNGRVSLTAGLKQIGQKFDPTHSRVTEGLTSVLCLTSMIFRAHLHKSSFGYYQLYLSVLSITFFGITHKAKTALGKQALG